MNQRYLYTSLTRIASLADIPFEVKPLPRDKWATGDYVVGQVNKHLGSFNQIELPTGRIMEVAREDWIIGAFGIRYATLEITGSWEDVADDGQMYGLTSAGLFGQITSISPFCPSPIPLQYKGHVYFEGRKLTMGRFVRPEEPQPFETPTILVVGTSMSAGKTTTAKIIVRLLKQYGLRVLGAKLTGAGRYRDILGMADAGADHVFDFVDVGLPSTICPSDEYRDVLRTLLSKMSKPAADVAVIEIGASPLEPYNGAIAYDVIKRQIRCTILCASDPYAVLGVMKAFNMKPDVVGGPATNTQAGIELIEKMCGVEAFSVLENHGVKKLNDRLARALEPVINIEHELD